jgi:two-component system LytT family response regulator
MKIQWPIRALIVEDEPLARQTIRDFLEGEAWIELVGEAADGRKAVALIDELRPDLLFLDVKMPGMSGLQVLETIKHDPEVVFTTAYDDHAVTAFELEALDYILKPFGRERFRQVLERIRRRLASETQTQTATRAIAAEAANRLAGSKATTTSATQPWTSNDAASVRKKLLASHQENETAYLVRLFVRDGRGGIVHLPVADITCLTGADDYVEVHSNNLSYLVGITLSEFEKRLDPMHFRRINRSAIVNLNHLVSCRPIDRRLLLRLSDGSELIASRGGSKELRDLILRAHPGRIV